MKTVINIKTDKEVKQNAQMVAESLGFSLSSVINAYLKQFIRNKEVHFSIGSKMTSELEDSLRSVEYDINRKRNLSEVISEKDGLNKHLSSL